MSGPNSIIRTIKNSTIISIKLQRALGLLNKKKIYIIIYVNVKKQCWDYESLVKFATHGPCSELPLGRSKHPKVMI